MEGLNKNLFFSSVLYLLLLRDSVALDTIAANQAIRDGENIVSANEMFELGFFSPGKSSNRYLGIWYKKIANGTVVWVANRETPIIDRSGALRVSSHGALQVLGGSNNMIWSSESSAPISYVDPVAQLLDNGNLVVWDKNKRSTNRNLIWQSFDYPGNTLLPGMKLGKDLVTGRHRNMTSWKSPDDPSTGQYQNWVDTNGYPQIFSQGPVMLTRIGPWNGLWFRGMPADDLNPFYLSKFVVNHKEIHYKYELYKSSVLTRLVLSWDGNTMQFWIERIQDWVSYGTLAVDSCGHYGLCGPYGSCSINKSPPCACMEGFEPRSPEEWNSMDWSSGCQRSKLLDCGNGDGFQKISGVKFPDTRNSWYSVTMTLVECEMACKMTCSCTAYANLDIRNGGSGCLLWFDELKDVREYEDKQDIYIRMAASESSGNRGFVGKKAVLTIVLSVSSVLLLLSAVVYACRNKKKWSFMKGRRGNMSHLFDEKEYVDELPFFSLYTIAKATDNFSIGNKIGEGGFGPVYKGVLEDGREIAVKRLSQTSQQGLKEFKNEIICIAKLQHRKLVKLLGYCIHGDERSLIYEYMANKSLDSYLFDESRSSVLDWPRRFCIIHGIARGILYLHQDSRLQIIHRDLKAANILLDSDMNPKISDFGLARRFAGEDAVAKTKKVVGTYGYISPEYAIHGRFSTKSDVFSFGVLILEIVSGMKIREFSSEGHGDNLLGHAWKLFKADKALELMSESLRNSCIVSEVLRSIHVGLLCVQHQAEDRPTMLSVVLMLISDSVLPLPKQPAFFTGEGSHELEPVSSLKDYMISLVYAR